MSSHEPPLRQDAVVAEFWRSTGRFLSRRTAAVLFAVVLILVGRGAGLRRLDFATGKDSDTPEQLAAAAG